MVALLVSAITGLLAYGLLITPEEHLEVYEKP